MEQIELYVRPDNIKASHLEQLNTMRADNLMKIAKYDDVANESIEIF